MDRWHRSLKKKKKSQLTQPSVVPAKRKKQCRQTGNARQNDGRVDGFQGIISQSQFVQFPRNKIFHTVENSRQKVILEDLLSFFPK